VLNPIVHVVDDIDFCRSLSRLLRISGFETAETYSGAGLLNRVEVDRPGCILLDLSMPEVNGLQIQKQLNDMGYLQPIIFVSGSADIPKSVSAMKAGADDFLTKPIGHVALRSAVQIAIDRCQRALEVRSQQDELQRRLAKLTPREKQVLHL
jgi:FixJ family two-component response regulator